MMLDEIKYWKRDEGEWGHVKGREGDRRKSNKQGNPRPEAEKGSSILKSGE